MSWIISGIPSMHCARVTTCAPDCINSVTVRPSRAPSTMKSEMMAIASGWLSLTPRSSLRRATMAAIEIKSLSFSRGERFMRALFGALVEPELVEPEPRQRRAGGTAEHGHHVGAEPGRILGTEPRHCKSIPAGDADLAAELVRGLADPLHHGRIPGHDQRGADGDTAIGDCRGLQFFADLAVEPDGFREYQFAAAAHPPAVDEFAMQHLFAHRAAAEHHDFT